MAVHRIMVDVSLLKHFSMNFKTMSAIKLAQMCLGMHFEALEALFLSHIDHKVDQLMAKPSIPPTSAHGDTLQFRILTHESYTPGGKRLSIILAQDMKCAVVVFIMLNFVWALLFFDKDNAPHAEYLEQFIRGCHDLEHRRYLHALYVASEV